MLNPTKNHSAASMLERPLIISLVIMLLQPLPVWAGPGHDHGDDAPAAATGDAPKRQATGEVFLPKPAQRQLSIRTEEVNIQPLAKVLELNGKVALDPQTGGMVQTTMGGHFVPVEAGVPQLGQKVQKGQVLGYVHKHQSPLEQSAQQAQVAQLKSQLTLAERRFERIQKLADTLPKKELDSAQSEVQSLRAQVSALSGGISSREALRSPSTGLIASSSAISGKVFAEGDMIFEVVNPKVVRVEASWFEPGAVPQFSSASIQAGNSTVRLKYLGASSSVKDQSLTLAFEARELSDASFPTGQLLKVYAEQAQKVDGIAIPSASVVKNSSNQTIVWVKKEPEVFEPKVVLTEPLSGAQVLVRTGLTGNERVVTQGATLINQVR
ncbi:MAG: efflux RND transporter periplasmic adaptor subunit [Limnobacter sp.]|nr:efflux RND transporter periplasmic adaptor subunit [Limnobacter sp.]